jgi:putative membrane protein
VTQPTTGDTHLDIAQFRSGAIAIRSVIGGAFMGLANLVPGISGGTMLLAVGVYPQFIGAVAEVSTLRFRPKVLLMLACVVGAAGVAIGGFAGVIGNLLDQYQWAMYCLFIGLTLGGAPLLWRMLRPLDTTVMTSGAVAVLLMALLALTDPERIGSQTTPGLAAYTMLTVAGFSGGAAMILPGVSGAYLLLILGQYRAIVDAVAGAADGARAGDWVVALQTLHVLIPVAIGVGLGVVGVSNLVRRLLANYERATLGFLLGLLCGAVIGLWPFNEPVPPQVGDIVRGVALTTAELLASVDPEDYRTIKVLPSFAQVLGGSALALVGFTTSWGISRFGR